MNVNDHHEDNEATENELRSVFGTGIFLLAMVVGIIGTLAFGVVRLFQFAF